MGLVPGLTLRRTAANKHGRRPHSRTRQRPADSRPGACEWAASLEHEPTSLPGRCETSNASNTCITGINSITGIAGTSGRVIHGAVQGAVHVRSGWVGSVCGAVGEVLRCGRTDTGRNVGPSTAKRPGRPSRGGRHLQYVFCVYSNKCRYSLKRLESLGVRFCVCGSGLYD